MALNIPEGTMPFGIGTSAGQSGGTQQSQSSGTQQSQSLGQQQSQSYGQNQSVSQNQNFSGLAPQYRNTILQSVVPQLTSLAGNMPQNIADWTKNAQTGYQQTMENMFRQSMPEVMNNLAARNMLNSSVASDAISKTANQIASNISPAAYQSQAQGFQALANMPGMLGQLAGLGKYGEGSGASQSSGTQQSQSSGTQQSQSSGQQQSASSGNQYSNNQSMNFNADPLAPYESIMAALGL